MEIGYLTEVIFQIIGVRTDHPTVRTGTIYYPYRKKIISNSYNTPFSKVGFRAIKILHVKGKISMCFYNLRVGKDFLYKEIFKISSIIYMKSIFKNWFIKRHP